MRAIIVALLLTACGTTGPWPRVYVERYAADVHVSCDCPDCGTRTLTPLPGIVCDRWADQACRDLGQPDRCWVDEYNMRSTMFEGWWR